MRIHLVNYEQGMNIDGILTKYSRQMESALQRQAFDVSVSAVPDPFATINHHINYYPYQHVPTINTIMITHFTQGTEVKLGVVRAAMQTADVGICFSPSMVRYLTAQGIGNLDFVLPAHDSLPRRKKRIALFYRLYPDRRKREWMLADLCKVIDPGSFAFYIMGDGWLPIITPLAQRGFEIYFESDFDINKYKLIMDHADFVLYTGDEDCMPQSMLDATQAGVRTIAPVHDWQEDLPVDFTFRSQEELDEIFLSIERNPVASWTWDGYVGKHLEIWKDVVARRENAG